MIPQDKLKEWSEAGWIVGPSETEESFVKRIDIQQTFITSPKQLEKKAKIDSLESLENTRSVMKFLEKHLKVIPKWIMLGYSNRGLTPWEGAAAWTFDFGSFLQLRKGFKKGRFLFYKREEVILHEALHSLRSAFDEPRFEEIIACYYAKKSWRRFFGPLFSTPMQSYIFLGTLVLTPFAPYVPLAYLLWRVITIVRDQRMFKRALLKICDLFPQIPPFALMIRLTDKEIELFGNQDKKVVQDYIDSQQNNLRWKQFSLLTLPS